MHFSLITSKHITLLILWSPSKRVKLWCCFHCTFFILHINEIYINMIFKILAGIWEKKKPCNSKTWFLHLRNKFKIHNYSILNYKCYAKKTTVQWTAISVKDDQRIKNFSKQNGYKLIFLWYVYIWFSLIGGVTIPLFGS